MLSDDPRTDIYVGIMDGYLTAKYQSQFGNHVSQIPVNSDTKHALEQLVRDLRGHKIEKARFNNLPGCIPLKGNEISLLIDSFL